LLPPVDLMQVQWWRRRLGVELSLRHGLRSPCLTRNSRPLPRREHRTTRRFDGRESRQPGPRLDVDVHRFDAAASKIRLVPEAGAAAVRARTGAPRVDAARIELTMAGDAVSPSANRFASSIQPVVPSHPALYDRVRQKSLHENGCPLDRPGPPCSVTVDSPC
jgi:hypothetical protein